MTTESLDQLQIRIRACRQCVDAGYIPEAIPIFRGGPHNRRMIIGQAPGKRSHESGVPWTGTSGRILRGWLAEAGFDPGTFDQDWYFTSITKCFPGPANSGSGDRVPSRAEQVMCAPWLEQEINLVKPELIVSLGKLAFVQLVPTARKLTLREIIENQWKLTYPFGNATLIPLPHPSGVSRWLNSAVHRELLSQVLHKCAATQ